MEMSREEYVSKIEKETVKIKQIGYLKRCILYFYLPLLLLLLLSRHQDLQSCLDGFQRNFLFEGLLGYSYHFFKKLRVLTYNS